VPTRRLPIVLTVSVAIIAALLLPTSVGAETDAERERERVRQEQAAAAANVDALEAEQSEVLAAIADLEEQVAAEEAALASAEREVAEAEAAQARAQEGIQDAEAHLTGLEERLREQMVESYTASDGGAGSVAVLDADNATDMVKRQAILDVRSAEDDDLADQVRAAQADLRVQRREAEAAEERAAARRAEVEERLASVEAARDQQDAFAEQVEERIDNETARALELGQQEAELSAEILREQAEARAILLWQQQEAQRREDAAAAAAAVAAQPTGPAYDDDGRETAGPVADPSPSAPASAPPSGGPVGSGNGVSLCNAAGITVNCQIAGQVTAMINAAAGAGVSLSGGGYRDPSRQIELRRQNCGSSYYAIWEMSSSQCSPPTAKPGSSQHELGLAIDFSNCSRSSACFRWLSGNASSYGMYNLPSESWHWSVNGN
jgi:peptidoglycan hydrolase CwlO-like protein